MFGQKVTVVVSDPPATQSSGALTSGLGPTAVATIVALAM